ncbi:GSCOCG00008684001-RA-CDS [Cotesia congregata]|nr:GSCOCG00008684001-RA-CDS [Cotesia congregata]
MEGDKNKFSDKKFASDKEVISFMEKYAKELGLPKYSTGNSKNISAQPPKNRFINPRLVKLYMKFHCPYSGIYKPTGKGLKTSTSRKTNCPAIFHFKITNDGNFFYIESFSEEHNHAIQKENTTDVINKSGVEEKDKERPGTKE